jgi:glycolate oxidase
MNKESLLTELRQILPATRLLMAPAQLRTYESDGLTTFKATPLAVTLPETSDEVVQIVRACARHHTAFVARGSGTGLSGGATPVGDGIVIALNRLDRILTLDPEAGTCLVEPGVLNQQVSAAAAPFGLHFAPDPSSGAICTIGGNVAFNAGGAHCLKYGMTANHVLGIKAVLPDGEVVQLGSGSLEACSADLPGFFSGSEGLFGIALEITLRLIPRVEQFKTFLAAYPSTEAAGNAVSAIIAAGLLPGALEIMDRLAMDAAEAAIQPGYPAGALAMLIIELEGPTEEVEAETTRLQAILESSGASEIRLACDEADRARIWKGRKSAFSAAGRLSPEYLVQDGVVPRSKLGEALREISQLSQEYGIRVANVFHAGDGNLHPLIMFDSRKGEQQKAEELAGEILRLCIRLGGSITGEHGVGLEKRLYLPELYPGADFELLGNVQRAIDPHGIANPGKMLERTSG